MLLRFYTYSANSDIQRTAGKGSVNTYLPACLPASLPTYLPTYMHTYIQTLLMLPKWVFHLNAITITILNLN